jgi:hypothetical protein
MFGGELPEEDERFALLIALGELVEARGAKGLLSAPLLFAEHEFFPDDWHPDLDGVSAMARRLLSYAGLGRLEVEVHSFSDRPPQLPEAAGATSHQGVAANFWGIEEGICFFGVEESGLSDPEQLVGVMAHEVAHAYRAFHGLVVPDRDREEQLTDLTTVFLGFGVLTTNAADRFRSSGEMRGGGTLHRWSRERAGYLSPPSMALLLAACVLCRGNAAERKRVKKALERNQSASFAAALEWLEPRAEKVRTQLQLSTPATSHPEHARIPVPEAPPVVRRPELHVAPGLSNAGLPVFRLRRRGMKLVPSMVGATGGGVVLAVATGEEWLIVLTPLIWWLVERFLRKPVCSGCDARIPARAATCPLCGGTVAGDIERLRDVHDAEEAYWGQHRGPRGEA